jgi:hypothetical protein
MAATATTGRRNVSAQARLGLLLFGLIFLGVSLSAGYFLALPDLRDRLAAREYVPVPAKLLSVELKRHCGSKSTTYSVRAIY